MSACVLGCYPVLGELHPWLVIDASWGQYETPTMHGLARVDGKRVDVLAMAATTPGIGDGGRFLADLMRAYQTVRVYEVMDRTLEAMLRRRGFVPFEETEPDGCTTDGFVWTRT